MGYDDNRLVVILQIPLQPLNGWHVQVVGRLVQQHDIRSSQKQFDKSHLGLLPAGKAADGACQILQCKTKPLDHRLHIFSPGISPHCLHPALQIVILPQKFSVLRGLHQLLNLMHPFFTGKNRCEDFFDLLLHGHIFVRKIYLTQKSNLLLSRHRDATFLITIRITHLNIPGDQL